MRLIDADKLLDLIKDQKEKETGAYTKGINKGLSIVKSIICDEAQTPTAYDPDKVVEQLEDYGNEETRYYKNTPYEKCIEECIGKAIEIVKGGGVDGN